MKKVILIAFIMMLASFAMGEVKTFLIDYRYFDSEIRPISLGITSFSDRDKDTAAIYGSVCMFNYKSIRFEIGSGISFEGDVAFITGFSYPIKSMVLGAWYAPFWGLDIDGNSDDPWGIMVGYRF
jgi:hypothetical protein